MPKQTEKQPCGAVRPSTISEPFSVAARESDASGGKTRQGGDLKSIPAAPTMRVTVHNWRN